MPPNPAPGQADSARKIANYTQSISSGVTNLLTELGRVSVPASPQNNELNNAILLQLQTITAQIAVMNTRLDGIEQTIKGFGKPPSDTSGPTGGEPVELPAPFSLQPPITVEAHNELARHYNKSLRSGTDILLPLRNSRNMRVLGFPATLGDLVHIDPIAGKHLCKAFGISGDWIAFSEFCGVSNNTIAAVQDYYTNGERIALERAQRRQKRDTEIAAAGPPTARTRNAAENHNRIARVHNGKVKKPKDEIMPIHDERNIPVTGFPKYAGGVWGINCGYYADVLFFLVEYKKISSPYVSSSLWLDYMNMWFDLTGVSMDAGDEIDFEVPPSAHNYCRR